MKRSYFNRTSSMMALMLIMLLTGFGQPAHAQNEDVRQSQSVSISTTEDGKVKLKVIQKKGNDETTFEKTYDSYEEMENDPDLEKYGINTNSFGFNFGGGKPQVFFHKGPGQGFWDDDDFGMGHFRDMREKMEEMMREFYHDCGGAG